ncbi:MAG: tetratricopeptide repeat protein [Verrucomicrobia bacterium]|nr:tetratricopeptide repeat protein [Verrucomicrobiota bacterium]
MTPSRELSPRWLAALAFAATLVAYWPALSGTLLWDDAGHVTRADLQSLSGLARIWFEPGATQQYYPLLHSAFWLEHQLWGDATLGYHLVNVLLHATSACLFAALLRQLTIPGASIAALLFALHPVCVESVAWISEQKNTLSLVFYLGAALAHLRFNETRARRAYALATTLFVCALLAKTVTATLPAALLVIIWWRRGEPAPSAGRLDLRRDVLPLLPWFALSLAAGLTTAWFERTLIGAAGSHFELGLVERGLLAGRVIWFYLGKLLGPANLMFIYPRWTVDVGVLWQFLFPLAAVGVAVALWFQRQRGLLAAWLLFIGSLFPALGFFNVYPFIFSWVADHFQYLACLPILALIALGLSRLPRAIPLVVLLILGGFTWRQSAIYRDPVTLFETTLRKNPACWMAHNNLAEELTHRGQPAGAIPHLEAALRLRPDFPEALNNLGDNLRRLGRPADAVGPFEKALKLRPRFAEAHNNLGIALMELNRASEGIARFEEALRLNPRYAVARHNLGLALASSGRPAEAIAHFQQALRLDPDYADAELNWAVALTVIDRPAEAFAHFDRALQLNPLSAPAHFSRARALATVGRYDEAESAFRRALEIDPTSSPAHLGLGQLLRQMGRTTEADEHLRPSRDSR